MQNDFVQHTRPDLDDINEKLRKDLVRGMEPHGARPVADLADMTEVERTKWLFWNLHERLDDVRQMEPTLIGHVTSTQLTVSEGQSMLRDAAGLEKRLELSCKWNLLLTFSATQTERSYEIGDGWVNLCISDCPPSYPSLHERQRGYLNGDHSLFPNQLVLDGWITEPLWHEIKAQLYTPNPNCRTDILLLDNYLFPVKRDFPFVTGPAGSIGLTNMEFRSHSHPTERRMTPRRSERART